MFKFLISLGVIVLLGGIGFYFMGGDQFIKIKNKKQKTVTELAKENRDKKNQTLEKLKFEPKKEPNSLPKTEEIKEEKEVITPNIRKEVELYNKKITEKPANTYPKGVTYEIKDIMFRGTRKNLLVVNYDAINNSPDNAEKKLKIACTITKKISDKKYKTQELVAFDTIFIDPETRVKLKDLLLGKIKFQGNKKCKIEEIKDNEEDFFPVLENTKKTSDTKDSAKILDPAKDINLDEIFN